MGKYNPNIAYVYKIKPDDNFELLPNRLNHGDIVRLHNRIIKEVVKVPLKLLF